MVAVTGGGIKDEEPAWIIKPTIVGETRFADIYTNNYRCKHFLGNDFNMVRHIKAIRNIKVNALMRAFSQEDDPNEEHVQTDGTVCMPKRGLIDRIPKVLTIDVETASNVATVNVLPAVRVHGVLQIEITQPNLDLLLEEPPAEPAPWIPEVEQQNVYWNPRRNQLQCLYWDSKKLKYRYKTMRVEFLENMNTGAKQVAVSSAAAELQEFYDKRHNHESHMPGQEEDCEADDDVSVGSAASEPMRTCRRTEIGPESPA